MNVGRARSPSHAPMGEESCLSEGGGVHELPMGGSNHRGRKIKCTELSKSAKLSWVLSCTHLGSSSCSSLWAA